jgi:hypothetical protein
VALLAASVAQFCSYQFVLFFEAAFAAIFIPSFGETPDEIT